MRLDGLDDVEPATNDLLCDRGQTESVAAGVPPQQLEGIVDRDVGALGDDALGLLDADAAGQCVLQSGARVSMDSLTARSWSTPIVAMSARARARLTSSSESAPAFVRSRLTAPIVRSRSRIGTLWAARNPTSIARPAKVGHLRR